VAEFCRREGITQPTFYQWRKRLSLAGMPARSKDGRSFRNAGRTVEHARQKLAPFVELSLAAGATVEIELPNGAVVRVPADREGLLRVAILAAGEWRSRGQDTQVQEESR
jgi:transposase-like protein